MSSRRHGQRVQFWPEAIIRIFSEASVTSTSHSCDTATASFWSVVASASSALIAVVARTLSTGEQIQDPDHYCSHWEISIARPAKGNGEGRGGKG